MYFSRTFKALNFDFQIQGLSRTFKVRANPVQFVVALSGFSIFWVSEAGRWAWYKIVRFSCRKFYVFYKHV